MKFYRWKSDPNKKVFLLVDIALEDLSTRQVYKINIKNKLWLSWVGNEGANFVSKDKAMRWVEEKTKPCRVLTEPQCNLL